MSKQSIQREVPVHQREQSPTAMPAMQPVKVAIGAGNEPIEVPWEPNDTVATVLQRADVKIGRGKTPTLGKRRVRHPESTAVSPGDVIVVAGMPANG